MAPVGRPSKYDPKYCKQIIEFFDVPAYCEITKTDTIDGKQVEVGTGKMKPNDLPMMVSFAHKIGVSRDTLHEWKKNHPEFSDAYKKAKELQERNWRNASMLGLYNPAFTIFMGKNVFKWNDRQILDQNVTGNLKVEIVKFGNGHNKNTE